MSNYITPNSQNTTPFVNDAGYINESNYYLNSKGEIENLYKYPSPRINDILVAEAATSSGVLNNQQTTTSPSSREPAERLASYKNGRLHVYIDESPQISSLRLAEYSSNSLGVLNDQPTPTSPSSREPAERLASYKNGRLYVYTEESRQISSLRLAEYSFNSPDSPEDIVNDTGLNRNRSLIPMLPSNKSTSLHDNMASIARRYEVALPNEVQCSGTLDSRTPENEEILTPFRNYRKDFEFVPPVVSEESKARDAAPAQGDSPKSGCGCFG